jgi:hypothetical protein
MKKHYETHVEDTDKLISVAGPVLDYKSWYEQYRKLMEEQAQRKYGLYTPTSEGDDDDFPSITGMIARYSAKGLTNEEMSKNPVWKDLTGNDMDLQMKNFAWKGMSGVGGYVGDFSKWVNNRDTTEIGITKSNSKVIIDVKVSQGSGKNIVFISKSNLGISNNVTIKITSTYPEGVMKFANSASNKYLKLPSNGIITLQDNPEYTSNEMHLHLASADLGQITIEQLPLYPGALVFDGVDDYGVCENFPILTKEKGYTVVALRQWITRGEIAQGLVSNVKNWLKDGAFLLEYRNIQADHLNKPISFGAIGSEMDLPHILTYQTSKSYNGVSITTGNFEGTDVLHVGKLAPTNVGTCINAAIWELVFLDHDATEEELTKIKDYFVKTYPWLFPDQAWTVVGKTKEDEDRATIANITGNGNDLVLSNFGFAEGSGYNEEGEYAGYLVTDGVDDSGRAVGLTISKDFTLVGEWILFSKTSVNAGLSIHPQIHIFNRPEVIQIIFRTAGKTLPVKSLKAICSDGRCYDENWSELKINVGEFTGNKGTLFVASNGTNYAQIAFKNLGIYDNQILSKDDCIKAYNYLQTLKAK